MYVIFYVHKNVTLLLTTADVIANSRRYSDSSSVLLPIYAVAMAVKAMCKYYGKVSEVIRIFIPSVVGKEECV
jgi:hypothetical protein